MADNRMKGAPDMPTTGPNTVDPSTQVPPEPPLGNAADPTERDAGDGTDTSATFKSGKQPDPDADLHTVGADPSRHGALGKTDVNLGQNAPIDAGAEGLNLDDLDEDEAA